MPKRQRNEPTVWSWTVEESGWTSPSRKDLTPPRLESTWAGPHTVEAAAEVVEAAVEAAAVAGEVDPAGHVATRVTTTAGTTAGTTGVAMIAMMTGITTTDHHTEGDRLPRTTEEERTAHGPGHAPILHVVIEHHFHMSSPSPSMEKFPENSQFEK